jgi:hypothetical protein
MKMTFEEAMNERELNVIERELNVIERLKQEKKCMPDWTGKCRFCKTQRYINGNDDCEYIQLIGGVENE